MSIVALKKVTFCGLLPEKTRVLEQLQGLGGLHLVPLNRQTRLESDRVASDRHIEPVGMALNYLLSCPLQRHPLNFATEFDAMAVAEHVLSVKHRIRETRDTLEALNKRIRDIEPWGDFDLPSVDALGGQRLWFYQIPLPLMPRLENNGLIWQTVHKSHRHGYVVVIAPQEPPQHRMPVPPTPVGPQPLSERYLERNRLELMLDDLQAERASLTRWRQMLAGDLNRALDQADLKAANMLTRDEFGLFIVQGWLPAVDVHRYAQFAAQAQIAMVTEDPADTDHPPTLLSNPAWVAGGEDLVRFYQIPSYRAWDPSVAVFTSFAIFFSMILSDAGYALLMLSLVGLRWRRWGRTPSGRRLRNLAVTTLVASTAWGVMIGSYFGVSPSPGSLADGLKLFDIRDFPAMMRLSVIMGVVHIVIANGIRAQTSPNWRIALPSAAWIVVALSGLAYWLAYLDDNGPIRTSAAASMVAGGFMLVMFSSQRPLRTRRDWAWRLFDGIKSLAGLTQLFGDALSYLRLFALGLAGASLAVTFNQLAHQVHHALPGLGLFFSLMILLLGHALNLALCVMSGVVHGLRLNFIEFYNWSLSDEGYPFKAFSKRGRDR